MIHRPGPPADGRQKVFIAVAAYQGLGAGFAYSIFHTGAALTAAGIKYELAIYSGNCHVDDSRNRLAADFLASDCTDLFFLDADIGWAESDFIKLLSYDRDVVAGVYPKKNADDTFPVKTLPGEIWSDAEGLIEVAGVPTGFLRIRRNVIEALAEDAVTYNAKNDQAFGTALIFERQVHDGTRWGGDYVFCRKWRARGGKIYIDPALRLEHSGEDTWTGSVGQWLRTRSGIGLMAGLSAIRQRRETIEDVLDLYDAWSNPFAADPVMLSALIALARETKGPIIECGAGLSTLVLAAANPGAPLTSLEDNPVFADQVNAEALANGLTVSLLCKPHNGEWYDAPDEVRATEWAMAFIDGPRRTVGGRAEALKRLNLSRAVVIADDIQSGGGHIVAEQLANTHELMTFLSGTGTTRHFAIAVPKQRSEARAA